MTRCFHRARIFVLPFWGLFLVVGLGVLVRAGVDPWWVQYPVGISGVIIGLLGILNYGVMGGVCVTPHEFQWSDWFGLRSLTMPLGAITRVVEEKRRGRWGWFSVAVVRWRGGHVYLSPHVWRKSDIRNLVAVLEERHPSIEVEPRLRDLLSGTDYWVKR